MSPAVKIGPLNQHDVLHGHYGPTDCCLCRVEAENARLREAMRDVAHRLRNTKATRRGLAAKLDDEEAGR